MPVFQRNGTFYYQVMVNRERFNGVCKGCTTLQEAKAYADEEKHRLKARKTIEAIRIANNEPLDPRDVIIADLRAEIERLKEKIKDLQGGDISNPIKLGEAFNLSLFKPHSRECTKDCIKHKARIWDDFVAFMCKRYPQVEIIQDVTKSMCEAYVSNFSMNGRTDRLADAPISITIPAACTINRYMNTISEVFRLLKSDAGMLVNPFDGIQKPRQKRRASREAFTLEEAKKIIAEADPFTKPLFVMAFATGLREGDIATLKWSDVDLNENVITKYANKTNVKLEIPIMDWLHDYLSALPRKNQYVFPDQAKMYFQNRTGISYRVKTALKRMGFNCNIEFEKGKRGISRYDLHSCRHTFCTFAGMAGIPLVIVQGIVGHASADMTAHYSAHSTLADRKKAMEMMPKFYQP